MNAPTLVIWLVAFPSWCVGAFGSVSVYLDLNFKILNIFLSLPILSCLKKTGPLLSHLMAIATISIGKDKRMIAKNEQNMSKHLLKNEYIGFFFIIH